MLHNPLPGRGLGRWGGPSLRPLLEHPPTVTWLWAWLCVCVVCYLSACVLREVTQRDDSLEILAQQFSTAVVIKRPACLQCLRPSKPRFFEHLLTRQIVSSFPSAKTVQSQKICATKVHLMLFFVTLIGMANFFECRKCIYSGGESHFFKKLSNIDGKNIWVLM